MSTIYLNPNAGAQVLATQAARAASDAKPALRLEIKPIGPFDFSYTKIRADTGEAVWRWPRSSPPSGIGDLIDVSV